MRGKLLALCLTAALAAGLAGCGKADPSASVQPTPDPKGTILVDEDDLTVTADAPRQGDSGVELDLTLENTGPAELTVSVASCSVNGYMTGAYFLCAVPPQGHARDTVTIYADELLDLGVTQLADVAVSFNIDDADGGHRLTSPRLVTTPQAPLYDYSASLLQNAMADPEWTSARAYQVLYSATGLYDQDGIALCSAFLVEDAFGARNLRLELENRSAAERATVAVGDIALNGTTLSASNYGLYPIDPGKRYLTTIGLEYLIPDGAQESYSQLREVGLSINGTAVQFTIPQ